MWVIYHALATIAGAARSPSSAWSAGWARPHYDCCGLAVAIPAVLAYNVYGRITGRLEADLEGFARDLRELPLG